MTSRSILAGFRVSQFDFRHDGRQPVMPVFVGAPEYASAFSLIQTIALVDTGSTMTLVSSAIVRQLELMPLGKRQVIGIHGNTNKWEYRFRLALTQTDDMNGSMVPFFLAEEILGADFEKLSQFDVLIGMDVLSKGTLTIRPDGTGSFRV